MYYLGQVAYYELNIDYIIENYCVNTDKPELQCNGKCHLAQQLQAASPDDDTKENPSILLECFYSIFNNAQVYEFTVKNDLPLSNNKLNSSYQNRYNYLMDRSLLKPPMV